MLLLDETKKFDLDRLVRLVLGVGTALGLCLLVGYLSDILIPFGVAFVLAYLLNPVATFFQRKTGHRAVAVGITMALFLGVIVTLGLLVVPRIVGEVAGLSHFVQEAAQKSPAYWQSARAKVPQEILNTLYDSIRSDQIQSLAASLARKLAPGLWGLVTGALSLVVGMMTIIVVLMYLAFLLLDFQRVQSSWKEYLPPRHRDTIVEFLEEFNAALSKYFRGQSVVALLVGVLSAVGFMIVDIRLAIVLGLAIGVLSMVPYLKNVALVPAFLLALLRYLEKGDGFWWYMIGTAAVFLVVQIVEDAVLVPKIMGEVTGLRPAIIMLSTFVWGKLLGFVGLLLAIPLTVLAMTYYERAVKRQRALMAAGHAVAQPAAKSA